MTGTPVAEPALEPVLAFLDRHDLGTGDAEVVPIGEGHSNLTYLVLRGTDRYVLRRPPHGPRHPGTHDMLREARVLHALRGRLPVPDVLAVCDDESVIGVPFYVMEYVAGLAVGSSIPARLDTPAQRRRMSEALVDALAELHAVEWRGAGLEGFGRPEGYLGRQLARFGGLWEHNRTREVPAVDAVAQWLRRHVPASPPSTVVHGDYRLGNVLFSATDPTRLVAVLDWEMSTLGDPLADLGYLCMTWSFPADLGIAPSELARVTRADGFLARDELVERYEARTGRRLAAARWYEVLALWKTIVFMEGNYRRVAAGDSDDAYARDFGESIHVIADHALALTRSP